MLKLVRFALTTAILTAIAVRLRRRARTPGRPPVPPAPAPAARGAGMGLVWAGIAMIVALVLTAALLPGRASEDTPEPPDGPGRARAARQEIPQSTATPISTPTLTLTSTQAPAAVPDSRCSPEPRPVTVRPVDPKVRRAVNRQWRRVERWLKANAPRTYRTLGAPGRARTIAIAESQMGVDFPDDLRASLLRHNGSRGPDAFGFGFWPGGAANLGTRDIRDAWRASCSGERTGAERLIPFLRQARPGAYAVVDSAGGAVGWDDQDSATAPGAESYYALMRTVADALERGAPVGDRRPAVERGVLRWQDAG
ncbi:SMI1/KNR4 family protein [Nonomuraea sp. NPDC004297]